MLAPSLSITDPVERTRLYGQSDHVRQYGEDFRDRLESVGFGVLSIKTSRLIDPTSIKWFSIECEKEIIFALKQDGNI